VDPRTECQSIHSQLPSNPHGWDEALANQIVGSLSAHVEDGCEFVDGEKVLALGHCG
jgi:hypothetical protein